MRRVYSLLCQAGLLALLAILGFALVGCEDDEGTQFRSIPLEFTGTYVGTASSGVDGIASTRQGVIGDEAAIQATVTENGNVGFVVTTLDGVFTASGGILLANNVQVTGYFGGDRIDFFGVWTPNGFGSAAGTFINRDTGETGTWSIAQQGLTDAGAAGAYSGTFAVDSINGTVNFTIGADGGVTGTATGLGVSEVVDLTGAINEDDVLVMTGTYEGEPVFFIGALNTTTNAFTDGFVGTGAEGGLTGTWSASQPT